jgi:SAM-dependent methyltransferase
MNKSQINIDNHVKNYIEEISKENSLESVFSGLRKKQVLISMNKYKHNNILEIGCGLDPLYPHINGWKSYTIVEPGTDFLKALKGSNLYNVNIYNGFLEDVYKELLENKFDYIFLSGVLHHVPNLQIFLKAISQLCSCDTVVHINVPNAYSFHRLLAMEMGYINNIFEKSETNTRLQVKWVFNKDSLYKVVQNSGFEVLDFGTYFIKLFTNEQMEKVIDLDIFEKDILQGLENMVKYLPDMGCEMFVNIRRKN